MKFLKFTLALFLTVFALTALGGSFDQFAGPRFVVLSSGTDLTNHSGTLTASNSVVDIHGYDGVAAVYFNAQAYAGSGGKIYAYLEDSADGTNFFMLTNVAAAVSATYNMVNYAYSTNGFTATNSYLLPGTVTTATASSAGFAGTYLAPAAFTGYGVLCTNVSTANAVLGFPIQGARRYLHIAYTVTGSDVAFKTSAILVARKNSGTFY